MRQPTRPIRRVIRGSRRFRARTVPLATAAAALGLAGAGCGGGESQDANEPAGTWTVSIESASFPARQRLAQDSELRLAVRNVDDSAVPDLAVTIDSFEGKTPQPGVADPQRPIWVLDRPPSGSETGYRNTYTFGKLPPGEQRDLIWKVTAVKPGTYTVKYKIAAGLDGKSKAVLPGDQAPEGTFTVTISRKPRRGEVPS